MISAHGKTVSCLQYALGVRLCLLVSISDGTQASFRQDWEIVAENLVRKLWITGGSHRPRSAMRQTTRKNRGNHLKGGVAVNLVQDSGDFLFNAGIGSSERGDDFVTVAVNLL